MSDMEEDDVTESSIGPNDLLFQENDVKAIQMDVEASCDSEENVEKCLDEASNANVEINGLNNDISQENSKEPLLETTETGTGTSSTTTQVTEAKPDEGKSESEKDTVPTNLPECRSKRSYVCGYCNLKTLNPREYLYHLRDDHGEVLKKIFECSRCVYASKSLQKLVRHNHMVHKIDLKPEDAPKPKTPKIITPKIIKPKTAPKKANFSPMNRSPRESKSPRRFEEYEFIKENDLEFEEEVSSRPSSKNSAVERQVYRCDQCEFTTTSPKVLNRHETKDHLKRRFYRCSKCNYATHIKGRYAKHMKYHEMPIIHCEWCDFSTPYRWNLDRHNKNHTDEMGEFHCHLCNFKAQIKQSLTVHIANHHLTPEQLKDKESKRVIGVNEMEGMTEQEVEMLRLERDEDPTALEFSNPNGQSFTVSNIDMGSQEECERPSCDANGELEGEPRKKKPKIKITLKKMKSSKDSQETKERHNSQKDFMHPDDVVHRHCNVYIKTEKCSKCPFKAAFQSEIERHMKKEHNISASKGTEVALKKSPNLSLTPTSVNSTDSSDNSRDGLMEASFEDPDHENGSSSESLSSFNKMMMTSDKSEDNHIDLLEKLSDHSPERDSSREGTPKKKGSFFDKLQEKLSLTNVQNLVCQFCGHESKCLSESVRHQKLHLSAKNIYASASLSTRCQFCRHRCKTTDDLMNHLKSCTEARKNLVSDGETDSVHGSSTQETDKESIYSRDSESPNKHPMENRVFVWNSLPHGENSEKAASTLDEGSKEGTSKITPESSYTFADQDNVENPDAEIPDISELSSSTVSKKAFRCSHCNFWSVTRNRFHVHIIGHFNKKPYCCSDCDFRSNWRKEVTLHIKVKAMTSEDHNSAEALIFDETCEKNYEKYDQYQTVIKIDETHSNRTEGGLPFTRKVFSRRSSEDIQNDSAKSSPCTTPAPTNPSTSAKIPGPPKLTRAPNHRISSSPVPNAISPNIPSVPATGGESSNSGPADKMKFSMKPPPLVAMGQLSQVQGAASSSGGATATNTNHAEGNGKDADKEDGSVPANYQIITPQGAMSTSLETLQLLASGSTNIARLKKQQKDVGEGAAAAGGAGGGDGKEAADDESAISNQMRLLLWLNCLSRGAEQKDGGEKSSTNSSGNGSSSIMQLVLDHEGNPEWKCSTCDFRDNEQDTVAQHVRLAHGKKGPVSLVHAVHRCSVCGFAAGTKRHVLVHIETSHGGRGGIISRSEGQNVVAENGAEEASRSFDCKMCPYTCKKRADLKNHLSHHTPRVDYVFKCMFCQYYVATKNDLFEHLSLHGMEIPASAKSNACSTTSTATTATIATIQASNPQEDDAARQFICDMCPFEAKSRAKLMHHRQFHRPRGLPFSCNRCSYNVTRRHLLAQHLKIHGISPAEIEGETGTNSESTAPKKRPFGKVLPHSKSPSPSLTITPISSAASEAEKDIPKIDPACLPTISNDLTKNFHDIPLVWVSRDTKFFKMFKCRHCPHVNLRKSNIQEHEKMHKPEGPPPNGHKCQWCSYSCINAGVMTSHVKVHAGSMGTCHAIVDQALQNEQQLHMLASNSARPSLIDKLVKKCDEKLLYFCQHCPSRFFFEKEVLIHSRFHGSTSFANQCDKCNFSVRDAPQLLTHAKVHAPEYTDRTRTLMSMHPTAPSYPPVAGLSVSEEVIKSVKKAANDSNNSDSSKKALQINGFTRPWVSSPSNSISANGQPPPTSRFKCDQCPSTFSKLITLQYHQSLHSADNPFKCQRCSYAAKSRLGLDQHEALHTQADLEKANSESEISTPVPPMPSLSGPKKSQDFPNGSSGVKNSLNSIKESQDHPPIKLKFIGLKGDSSSANNSKKQFKYYIEEQVPLSGVELLKRKTQIEKEMPKDEFKCIKVELPKPSGRVSKNPGNEGNPKLHYPLHIDKSSGRAREKRYKCNKCPSAFEKLDQFNVHINLHGSNFKYKCRICDYSVKFFANFMMHIKRHKYHEKVDAQKKDLPQPPEEQLKYEPYIGHGEPPDEFREKPEEDLDKENHFQNYGFVMPLDITTAEKQQLILQHKKADAFKPKDEDKKVFYCQYCPYANTRRDAVDSHGFRHQGNNAKLYRCNFCDYATSQGNFIREHTKVHFRPFKYVQPEGFMRHEKQEIWSTISGDHLCDDDAPKKSLSFGHEEAVFTPAIISPKLDSEDQENIVVPKDLDDPQSESGILVDFRSGDVVEAPCNYIIPLRTSKSKTVPVASKDSLFVKPLARISSKFSRKKAKYETTLLACSKLNKDESEPEVKFEVDSEHHEGNSEPNSPTYRGTEIKNEEEYRDAEAHNGILSSVEEGSVVNVNEDTLENLEDMDAENTFSEDPLLVSEQADNLESLEEQSHNMEVDEAADAASPDLSQDNGSEVPNGYHENSEELLEATDETDEHNIAQHDSVPPAQDEPMDQDTDYSENHASEKVSINSHSDNLQVSDVAEDNDSINHHHNDMPNDICT